MHLLLVGLNHRTAPIEVRERLSFTDNSLAGATADLLERDSISEAVILSTCNRTEIYAAMPHAVDERALVRFLSDFHSIPPSDFESHLYAHHDLDAVQHLMRVACGLDSLVLGEPQILKQVRDAFATAGDAGGAGILLNNLFRASIAAGKRARTETEIGRGGFSIGHAAVDLARSIFGNLDETSILVLGAGKMSELTAKHLVANGGKLVLVANRTYEKAVALAHKLGGKAINYNDFPDTMAQADVVISSTSAPHPIIRRESLQPVMRKRRGRPLFLIDIAVPRDVAPDAATLDNVFLYDVDDLEQVVADMARDRAGETHLVEAIIDEEARKFQTWRRTLDAAPLVAHLKHKHEEFRRIELQRLRNQLPDLSDRAWQCIELAMKSMTNRVARTAIHRLKEEAISEGNAETYTLPEAARCLFDLNGCDDQSDAADTEETERDSMNASLRPFSSEETKK